MKNILHKIERADILKLFLYAIVFWILCPDLSIPSSDYDSYQFYQYKSLFLRLAIGLSLLAVLSFFVERRQILKAVVFAIALSGALQAVLSLLQLVGVAQSHHAIFRLTGSFYNPGPLGGYLAVCDVIAMAYLIKHKLYKPDEEPFEKYFYCAAALLMTIVLPATFSRTAWLALIAAVIYIVLTFSDVRAFIHKNKRKVLMVCLVAFVLIAAVFMKKSVSASGRFLIWKISAIAISEKPLTGHGKFEVAYRDASEKYFSQKNWSDAEFRAVDYVDHSFNEYMFMAIRYGIPAALLLVILLAVAFFVAHRKARTEFASGIIAFAVFAIASYPLHLADFVILLFYCLTACLLSDEKRIVLPFMLGSIAVGSVFGIRYFDKEIVKIELLAKPDAYYRNQDYSTASFFYEELYSQLSDNKIYMYDLAYSCYMNEEYDKAKKYFVECIDVCGNSNVFKFLGKIYLSEDDFVNAEKYLQRAINILPNRVEPYNLLIDLYSNENYRNDARLSELKQFVATHRFKQ